MNNIYPFIDEINSSRGNVGHAIKKEDVPKVGNHRSCEPSPVMTKGRSARAGDDDF
jgi:hypothetical protein